MTNGAACLRQKVAMVAVVLYCQQSSVLQAAGLRTAEQWGGQCGRFTLPDLMADLIYPIPHLRLETGPPAFALQCVKLLLSQPGQRAA